MNRYPEGNKSILGHIYAALIIGSAVALTAGYLYWAVKGSKPIKQLSQIEKTLGQYNKKGLTNLLNEI